MHPADDPDFQRAGLGCLAVITGLLSLFLLVRLGAHVGTGKVAFLSPGEVRMQFGPKSRATLWTDTFYRPRHTSIPDGPCVILAPSWHVLGMPVVTLLLAALSGLGWYGYRHAGNDYGGLVLGACVVLLTAYFLASFATNQAIRVERSGYNAPVAPGGVPR